MVLVSRTGRTIHCTESTENAVHNIRFYQTMAYGKKGKGLECLRLAERNNSSILLVGELFLSGNLTRFHPLSPQGGT
ncbi:hypothetical protein DSCOOX_59970 [Desulfosarcina ovata subsp. ovata]|uniref:Uncharacterized protein n=1 Tax=Desulfosarcina ovata subsp. ovata TaxID=2752305 RepID=A0A5K8AJE3_9BACT|nr:hypothetical protein DSCOOX_59970 [Desulfosarcina ovata subsp. ovata]